MVDSEKFEFQALVSDSPEGAACEVVEVNASRRFGGSARLLGEQAFLALSQQLCIMIVGVGGVGSWAAEALARAGVGHLILVDLDQVAESNINRQIQATDASLGKAKVQALAEHIAGYAPQCAVEQIEAFFDESTAPVLVARLQEIQAQGKTVVVLDCCDQVRAKVLLTALCRKHRIRFALAGSAGGKAKPWLVQPADLKDTINDPLLAKVRYQLRKTAGFSRDKKMGVPVFFSTEQVQRSQMCNTTPQGGLNCAGYGSLMSVTATMGMQMAAWVFQ